MFSYFVAYFWLGIIITSFHAYIFMIFLCHESTGYWLGAIPTMPLFHGSPIEFFDWCPVSPRLVTKLLKVDHIVPKWTQSQLLSL